jgi:hypothetical protein
MSSAELLFADAIDKLKVTVQEGRSFDAAQVRVVGLDAIRQAAGDRWDAIKERVRTNSMAFLQGCLGPRDIVIPAGDGFLILYGDVANREIASEAQTVQDALNSFYLGEAGMEKLRAQVAGFSIDAKNMHSVLALAGNNAANDIVEIDAVRSPATIGQASPSEIAAPHMGREIVFSSVWTVQQQAITTYFASWARWENGARRYGYNPAYRTDGTASEDSFVELDLAMLERATEAAALAIESGRKCLVGFSVHSSTFQRRPARQAYLSRLAATPEPLRKYLMGRIAEVSPGTPAISLTEWVGCLRTVTSRVAVELHPTERVLTGLDATGAFSISCTLPLTEIVTPDQRQRYAALMAKWTPVLQKQGLKFSVDNLIDPVLMEIACRVGVDSVTSSWVWPVREAPAGVISFQRSQIPDAFAQRKSA